MFAVTQIVKSFDDVFAILNKTEDDVVRVYYGKPGCMCGCQGTYTDKCNKMFNKAFNMIKHHFPHVYPDSNVGIEVTVYFKEQNVVSAVEFESYTNNGNKRVNMIRF